MPGLRVRIVPADALAEGIAQIKREAKVPDQFPPDVLAEAEAAAAAPPPERERVDLDFVTIDPPGARDLDQAMHLARFDGGYRISYAIADPAVFVKPGGALDRDTHERGVTVYAPDGKVPLHPPVISEGVASLLPGEWRPAVLWVLDLDADGRLTRTEVTRKTVRSVAQHTYEDVPDTLASLLKEIGEKRIAIERERGGVQLSVPEQEVVQEQDGWTIRFRPPNPYEDYNAQISLLTGMAAADIMLKAGIGILRTQPAPAQADLDRLRRTAKALGADWPQSQSYPEFIRSLDPTNPRHAALLQEATRVGRGAAYTAFDEQHPPELTTHWAVAAHYAHATAPLRRLQDRYVSECCLSPGDPPQWVRDGLQALPAAMANGTRRANGVERGVIDLAEALVLQGREGERFAGVVIDDNVVQITDPAVRGRIDGEPELGAEVEAKLVKADPQTRMVIFAL